MKLRTLSFIIIIIITTTNASQQEERKTLVLAGDYWCPYNCDSTSLMPEYLVEIVRKALSIYEIDIEYKIMPWVEALAKVKSGEIDGIIGVTNEQGLDLITTNLPLEQSVTSTFTRTDTDWVYDDFSSLRGKKIGVIMDYSLGDSINNYIGINYPINPDMFVIEDKMNAVIDSINNLLNGDIDVYIEDTRVVERYIRENGLSSSIRNSGKIDNKTLPVYVGLSAKVPMVKKYIKYLEEGIASLKATGEDDDLRIKYKMDAPN